MHVHVRFYKCLWARASVATFLSSKVSFPFFFNRAIKAPLLVYDKATCNERSLSLQDVSRARIKGLKYKSTTNNEITARR